MVPICYHSEEHGTETWTEALHLISCLLETWHTLTLCTIGKLSNFKSNRGKRVAVIKQIYKFPPPCLRASFASLVLTVKLTVGCVHLLLPDSEGKRQVSPIWFEFILIPLAFLLSVRVLLCRVSLPLTGSGAVLLPPGSFIDSPSFAVSTHCCCWDIHTQQEFGHECPSFSSSVFSHFLLLSCCLSATFSYISTFYVSCISFSLFTPCVLSHLLLSSSLNVQKALTFTSGGPEQWGGLNFQ